MERLFQTIAPLARSNFRRAFALLTAGLVLLPSQGATSASGSIRSTFPQTSSIFTAALRPGDSVAGTLDDLSQIAYRLPMVKGKQFAIFLDGTSPAIAVVLRRTDGRVVRELPCWYEGRRRISEIASMSGDYTVALQRCDER